MMMDRGEKSPQSRLMVLHLHPPQALPPAMVGEVAAVAAVGVILHRLLAVGVHLQLQAQGPQHHLPGANSAEDSTLGIPVLNDQVKGMVSQHRG